MNLEQLRAQLKALIDQADADARASIASAQTRGDGNGLNAEEQNRQVDFNRRVAGLKSQITALEGIAARGNDAPRATLLDAGAPATDATAAAAAGFSAAIGADGAPTGTITPIEAATALAAGRRVQVGAHRLTLDPMRGFSNTGDFARAVHQASRPMGGAVDRRLIEGGLVGPGSFMGAPTNYHQEGGSAEGAMVPPAIRQGIWQIVFADPLMERITVEPTAKPATDLIADETTPWGATGVQAAWRSEGTVMNPSKLATNPRQVRVHELYAFVLATQEIVDDAPLLNDRLNTKAPAAIRWKLVESFMFGDGAGKPFGWATSPARVAVARNTALNVKALDLGAMEARLLVDGPDRAFYVGNRDIIPQLIQLTIGNQPAWVPVNAGLTQGIQGFLMGRPLIFSEHCEALGTLGDLQLVNPDGYYALQLGSTKFDSSIHLYFDYNIQAFRWIVRFGGQPFLSAPIAGAKGTTKSHFVILN